MDPDPEPVGGMEPDPEPIGDMEPDPDPVGGIDPDPEPVGGIEPDPEPVGGVDPDSDPAAASNFPLEIVTFPFLTLTVKENCPESPLSWTAAEPEHFLSHFPSDAEVMLLPSSYRVKVQVQVFLPTFTFAFLKKSWGEN